MRFFCFQKFRKFMLKERIPVKSILEAARQLHTGTSLVALGGGVYKQRISRPGKGKSSGYRVILCNKNGSSVFFLHGYAKSSFDNISSAELSELKKLAKLLFELDEGQLDFAVSKGKLHEFNEEAI